MGFYNNEKSRGSRRSRSSFSLGTVPPTAWTTTLLAATAHLNLRWAEITSGSRFSGRSMARVFCLPRAEPTSPGYTSSVSKVSSAASAGQIQNEGLVNSGRLLA